MLSYGADCYTAIGAAWNYSWAGLSLITDPEASPKNPPHLSSVSAAVYTVQWPVKTPVWKALLHLKYMGNTLDDHTSFFLNATEVLETVSRHFNKLYWKTVFPRYFLELLNQLWAGSVRNFYKRHGDGLTNFHPLPSLWVSSARSLLGEPFFPGSEHLLFHLFYTFQYPHDEQWFQR